MLKCGRIPETHMLSCRGSADSKGRCEETMYYKEDWNEAQKRMEAFWEGEIIDRACVGICAPRKSSKLPPFPELQWGPWLGGIDKFNENDEDSIRNWWCDPEENLNRLITWFENTAFLGEACPATYVNWGASAMACLYGSGPVFGKSSVWYPKVIENWDTWVWNFQKETDPWWQTLVNIQTYLIEECNERYFVGTPELGNCADNLTLMRGMDKLSLDLYDHPDSILNSLDILTSTWIDLHEDFYNINKAVNGKSGVLAWMNLWAPERHDQLACDFSASISPQQFTDFFARELIREGEWATFATYHMDGPFCINNILDEYLKIDEIDCIEFTPGASDPPTATPAYFPLYRKIQASGKKLYLLAKPEEVEMILKELSPKGLFLKIDMDSEESAQDMLKKVEKWSVVNC